MSHGLLIVLSGPSGVGKGTVFNCVCNALPQLKKSISVTTRSPRPNEIEGVHYYYKTLEEYQQMLAKGEFLEIAEVYRNHYGTPKKPVFEMLDRGEDVIFEVDTLGAKQIKSAYKQAILILLFPPNLKELENRLRARGTESEGIIKTRTSAALRELKEYKNYDYIVINDQVEKASQQIINIIEGERCAVNRNENIVKDIIGGK